ncbi:MAG: CHASE2 domain-containing protein [Spirulinaceae cyanobacterium]
MSANNQRSILHELEKTKIKLKQKLAYFEKERAVTASPDRKFELQERIEECQQEIERINKTIESILKEIKSPNNQSYLPLQKKDSYKTLEGLNCKNKKPNYKKGSILNTILVSLLTTIIIVFIRQLGLLEGLELRTFDNMLRQRPHEEIDQRLLIVKVTEEDISKYGYPLPDTILLQLLEKLNQHKPRVTGLGLYRDQPQGSNYSEFIRHLHENRLLVASCHVGENNSEDPSIAPPSKFPKDRLGFDDVIADQDHILRRYLLSLNTNKTSICNTNSFGFTLALQYLKNRGIKPKIIDEHKVKIGNVIFSPLEKNMGGYQKIDDQGYQILINYRASQQIAQEVTITEILTGQVDPDWVQNKIVIIGYTAKSVTRVFATPYSKVQQPNKSVPGLLIHAHAVSQIISAALDKRPLIRSWTQWSEHLWIAFWSIIGGLTVLYVRSFLWRILVVLTALFFVYTSCFFLFSKGIWIPFVPPLIALILTMINTLISLRLVLKVGRSGQERY